MLFPQPPRGPPAPAPSARQAPLATEGPGRDPTRDPALNAIWQDATLSETFKLTYTQRLAAMASRLQRPISRVILQPQTTLPWVKVTYSELATRKNLVTAVLAALKRMPKQQHRHVPNAWLAASHELEHHQQMRLKSNTPSERQ